MVVSRQSVRKSTLITPQPMTDSSLNLNNVWFEWNPIYDAPFSLAGRLRKRNHQPRSVSFLSSTSRKSSTTHRDSAHSSRNHNYIIFIIVKEVLATMYVRERLFLSITSTISKLTKQIATKHPPRQNTISRSRLGRPYSSPKSCKYPYSLSPKTSPFSSPVLTLPSGA